MLPKIDGTEIRLGEVLQMKNKLFLDSIVGLAKQDPATSDEALRHIILQYGSETPDNIEAVQHLSYLWNEDTSGVGTMSGILAANIINLLEESPVPTEIKSQYPELKDKEWESILRFCTLVLCALENTKSHKMGI